MLPSLAAIVLMTLGPNTTSTVRALQVTARFSFLLFWLACAGGALATLFGPTFQAVARRGREFGLAFASAQLVHVGLVVWLYRISAQPPVSQTTFVFFGIAVLWTYLLASFSVKRLSQTLDPARWRTLRLIASEYISFAFPVDVAGHPLDGDAARLPSYLPSVILSVTTTFLRVIASVGRNAPPRRLHAA